MSETDSLLTPLEVKRMMKEYRDSQCNESATKLLSYYEPIVRMAASKMSRNRPDLYEDMIQVGQMSMLRLFTQFDQDREVPFEGYAMKSIIGHLKNYLRDKSWYIQVPRRLKEKGILAQRAIDEMTVKLGRSPKVEEIADYLELTTEETIEVLTSREAYQSISLDTPISSEGESAATIADRIPAESDAFMHVESRLDLQEALSELKEQEQIVLTLVYSDGLSQREIADQLGISQMSVSRIQRKAITKLRSKLEEGLSNG